jgi:uncharacterized protein (DUF983 family)
VNNNKIMMIVLIAILCVGLVVVGLLLWKMMKMNNGVIRPE